MTRRAAILLMTVIIIVARMAQGDGPEELTLHDPPFIVRYMPGDEAAAQRTIRTLNQALRELTHRLPAGDEPVTVILCDTMWSFRLHAGAYALPDVSGIAKPEAGVIVVKSPRMPGYQGGIDDTLRHELVHVLLARNTDTGVMPRWLNEGLAMMLSREYRWNSWWRLAQMSIQGGIIRYRDLDMHFLEPGQEGPFGDAYAQSLAMTRHLAKTIGDDALWALIGDLRTMSFGDAMRKHAGMSPPDFQDNWQRSFWLYSLVFWGISGFGLFQVMALLTIPAYVRMKHKSREIERRWEKEDHLPPSRRHKLDPEEIDEDEDNILYWDDEEEDRYL